MKNKDFESFPIHTMRVSDKTWEQLKKKKAQSGLTWNKYIMQLLEKKTVDK